MPDSYDLLAKSIERVIRSDLPPPATPDTLVSSIDRIMIEESRDGELHLAYLRVLVVAAVVALVVDTVVHRPALPWSGAGGALVVLSLAWLALAGALAAALRRRWYRRWVPRYMPWIDATMVAALFLVPRDTPGRADAPYTADTLPVLTVLCAFLSISGGLRLSRFSLRIGTALAVVVFVVVAAAAEMRLVPMATVVAVLIATGLLTANVTTLVRRIVTDEAEKTALSQMYKDAALAIDAREQVLRIVSHDLRTPLHTIKMSASMFLEGVVPPDSQLDVVRRMQRAGERASRLVNDLLDVAKLEAGRIAIAPRELAVPPLLEEAHAMLQPLAAGAGITLEQDVADSLPAVTADPDRVLQVLTNLVSNAVKFTPPGGRITIIARPAPGGVQFSVRDTGPGIPADKLERIFSRFWQADNADRRGIGLGLTIARGITDAHGGRLWVESEVGRGSTFHFLIFTSLPDAASSGCRDRRRDGGAPDDGNDP